MLHRDQRHSPGILPVLQTHWMMVITSVCLTADHNLQWTETSVTAYIYVCVCVCVCVRNLNDTEHLVLEPWTVRCIQVEQWVHGLPGCCASRLGSCWANTSGTTGFRRSRPCGQHWDWSSNSLHERHPLEEGEHYCNAVIRTVALSYDDMHLTNAPVFFHSKIMFDFLDPRITDLNFRIIVEYHMTTNHHQRCPAECWG